MAALGRLLKLGLSPCGLEYPLSSYAMFSKIYGRSVQLPHAHPPCVTAGRRSYVHSSHGAAPLCDWCCPQHTPWLWWSGQSPRMHAPPSG